MLLDKINDLEQTATLTICGSFRNNNRLLMEKYCAYYTIKNNTVFMPINYALIKNEVETFENADDYYKKYRENSHRRKIELSDAIIIITDETGYYGADTIKEVMCAINLGKMVLINNISYENLIKFDTIKFNHDKNYPLYLIYGEAK